MIDCFMFAFSDTYESSKLFDIAQVQVRVSSQRIVSNPLLVLILCYLVDIRGLGELHHDSCSVPLLTDRLYLSNYYTILHTPASETLGHALQLTNVIQTFYANSRGMHLCRC